MACRLVERRSVDRARSASILYDDCLAPANSKRDATSTEQKTEPSSTAVLKSSTDVLQSVTETMRAQQRHVQHSWELGSIERAVPVHQYIYSRRA